MKIALVTPSETIPLAGEDGVAMRSHGDASGLDISGQAAVRILQLCRRDRAIPVDDGNLAETVIFRSTRTFGSPAAAEAFAADHAAIPREGELVFDIDGSPRKMTAAVLQAPRSSVAGCTVTTTYAAKGAAIIEAGPPIPEHYINQDLGSGLLYRIVDDGSQKWFEAGILAPSNDLLGSAASGWTDAGGNLLFRLHRSEDLINWDTDWIEAPGSPEAVGDGDYIYWARGRFPVDSKVKTGQMWAQSPTAVFNYSDPRNNPITGVTINGVAQTLPNAPYSMPSAAATLQADLRAAGWTGATVVATSNINWRIDIPNVNFTDYSAVNRVRWPGYYVPDMYGALIILIDGMDFTGEFVNAAGVRTAVSKQFARLGVSPGPNYQY